MKVAILGGSPSTQMLAPFEDKTWEIWVLGNQLQDYEGKRVTRIFEIHDDISDKDPNYPQWLVDQAKPLIVGGKFPINAKHIDYYPIEKANKLLDGEFLSSSPAYMMAFAILEGATEIAIYGIDMAVDNHEYFKQRPEMYAWIAYAKAKGIKIVIPEESSLFKGTYVEGRDWGKKESDGCYSMSEFTQMAQAHQKRMDEVDVKIRQLQSDYTSHDGARQVYERLAKISRAMESGIHIKTLTETTKVN